MAFTNSHIHYDDYLTKISAMDTSIYLAIADASPDLPKDGSNLVFHGAQRFMFPYMIGLASKFFGVSSWISFQFIVHLCSLLTIIFLSKTLKVVSKANQNWNSFLLFVAIFHPFLFRLQIGFSGFINDAIFLAGLSIFVYGLLCMSSVYKVLGLFLMIPSKQTIYIIIPMMYLGELCFSAESKYRIHFLWLPTAFLAFIYYRWVSILIVPFSTPDTTSSMAFGFLHWIRDIEGIQSLVQLMTFIGRGILGLFLPFLALLSLVKMGLYTKHFDGNAKLVTCIFVAVILQPLISGPSITDASIQRLLSLGLPILLILIAILARQKILIGNSTFIFVAALLFIGSLHHLFSIIGPVLSYRYIFLGLYLLTSFLVIFCVFLFRRPKSDTSHVPI